MQKKALRSISLSKFNAHTDPLFNKYGLLKFEDLNKINCGTFMFNLAMGTHPHTLCELVKKLANFDTNLDFVVDKLPFIYLQKQAPSSLVTNWNNLNIALRTQAKSKLIDSDPSIVQLRCNFKLNQFRLSGFKTAINETLHYKYKAKVSCNNKF